MRFLSLFSGIDAASVAWMPLGWKAVGFSEIEAFPSAVLAHHYPGVPNLGDVTEADFDAVGPIDILVGGSPCQSFSVAGKRLGMDDPRGNLALVYGQVVYRKRPRWFVYENVPGLLSSESGRDFGTLIAALSGQPPGSLFEPPEGGWRNSGVVREAPGGYGLAWRVLDAQYVRVDGFLRAVPQRRRRVFVVGHLGDWRRAAAVLFERQSLQGNPPPRRKAGEGIAGTVTASSGRCSGDVDDARDGRLIAGTDSDLGGGLTSGMALDTYNQELSDVSHTLRNPNGTFGDALPAVVTATRGAESQGKGGYAGRRQEDDDNLVARCDTASQTRLDWETETFVAEVSPTLRAGGNVTGGDRPVGTDVDTCETLVAHTLRADGFDASEDGTGRGTPIIPLQDVSQYAAKGGGGGGWSDAGSPMFTLQAASVHGVALPTTSSWRVRRLTPTECERLQGFPDGWTAIPYRGKPAADGSRYKALGNSMAVNVMRWIGRRIETVDKVCASKTDNAA